MSADLTKTELRRRAVAVRDDLAARHGDIGERLVLAFASRVLLKPPRTIAGYAPTRSEVNPMPLMSFLDAAGWCCSLPVVVDTQEGLVFRAWHEGDSLMPGTFGVRVPETRAEAVRPDIVLVPLLAYDEAGHRLGYGAGCYDRALAHLRRTGGVLAVGLAYAGQRVASLPAQAHDQLLDLLVTEEGVTEFGKTGL
ncbi:MAG: 5-formyltetrahydrofolate cyclo-ligase [Alphaproteobacteria bacterium]|nr:5-formyltetrahydrofolate cyclo-ligase [Alphaproteobacteria bacterium]